MHSSEAGDSRVSPARLAGEMEIGFRVSLPEERVLTGNVAGKLSCFRRLLREIGATPSHGLRNDGRKVQVDLYFASESGARYTSACFSCHQILSIIFFYISTPSTH